MERYQSGKPIDFIIPLIDEQGEKFAATSVDVELFDESETSIHTDTLTPEVDAETVTATVDETLATITNGMNSEVRRLKVYLKSADTTIERDMYFMLEKTHAIVPTENSFVTYLESLRLMPEFPTFVAMNSATEDMRKSALIAAHRNIGMLEIADGAFKNADGEAFELRMAKAIGQRSSLPLTTLQT
ncbi:hypothetical protein JCM19235_1250 [Vibrio maritimus]|uniref:Uncharacterized protein n=1 Tax=Vibrio maritimus TaxID=990268 RepID=A0A090S8V3_9VIBR|nr:hypothetical protein JCM19235_1250 [Vibrio maritimus]